jgi:hypothetical protein
MSEILSVVLPARIEGSIAPAWEFAGELGLLIASACAAFGLIGASRSPLGLEGR